jgi:hypothetical protein
MELIVIAAVIFVLLALAPAWASDPKTMAKSSVILKDYYLKGMASTLSKKTILLARLGKQAPKIDAGGRKWGLQIESTPNEAVGARAERQTLPEPSHAGESEAFWYPGSIYGSFSITGQVIDAAQENPGAMVNEISNQTKALTRSVRRYANWAGYRDGSALLGTCVSASDSGGQTTIVINAGLNNDGARLFRPKQRVAVLRKSDGAVNGVGIVFATIVSVSKANNTITLDATVATAASINSTYGVYVERSYNLFPYGLQAAYNSANPGGGTDPNGRYGGLDRSAGENYWWCGNVLTNPAGAGTPRPLTYDLISEAIDASEGDEGDLTAAYMGNEAWRALANIVYPQRNWQANVKRLDLGLEYIEHNGIAFVKDKVAPADQIIFAGEKDLAWLQIRDYGPLDHDGLALRMADRVDEWVHDGVWRYQLACRRPCVGVILKDLAVRVIPTQS